MDEERQVPARRELRVPASADVLASRADGCPIAPEGQTWQTP
jgi:hypothetical protein